MQCFQEPKMKRNNFAQRNLTEKFTCRVNETVVKQKINVHVDKA